MMIMTWRRRVFLSPSTWDHKKNETVAHLQALSIMITCSFIFTVPFIFAFFPCFVREIESKCLKQVNELTQFSPRISFLEVFFSNINGRNSFAGKKCTWCWKNMDEKYLYVASRRDTERKVYTFPRTVGIKENKSKINQRNTWCCSCSWFAF